MSEYVVIIERAPGGGWGAYVPDLSVYATGDTCDEVEARTRDTVAFLVESLREEDLPIPPPVSTTITIRA